MTNSDLEVLHVSVDLTLRLCFSDGEIVTARIYDVSDEDGDVIYDVVASNRPNKYPDGFAKSAYLAHFEEIMSVARLES